jgi:predicted outer membrane protein
MRSAMASGRAVGTVLLVLAIVATLSALLLPIQWFDGNRSIALARSGWQDDGDGTWKTEYGPLTSLDRDFIRTVRSEALWELPAGKAAKERGGRKSVRTAGDHLVDGYTDLDKKTVEAARTLKLSLPNEPTDAQQSWLKELEQAKGDKFDRAFVDRLRRAHGQVFGLIGLVRDQTRNSMVRSLATRANAVVLDHLTVLEETGLVNFGALNDVK